MKKALLLSAIFFGVVYSAGAQYYNNSKNDYSSSVKFGIGLSSGFSTGPVSAAFPEAGALSFKFEFPVAKSPLSVLLSTGYTFFVSSGGYDIGFYGSEFGVSGYGGDGQVASFIPIEAGLKLKITPRVFIEGDAGVSFNINYYSSDYTGQKTAFVYSPAVGYSFPLGFSERQNLDLSLLYENRPEAGGGYSQFAARLVWNFGL